VATDSEEELDGEYRVQRVLERRLSRGEYEYKVRWASNSQDTWEPTRNLVGCQEMVAQFDATLEAGVAQDADKLPSRKVDVHDGSKRQRTSISSAVVETIMALEPPPEALRDAVQTWGLLTKWVASVLINDGVLTWRKFEDDTAILAELGSGRDDPTPLQRLVDRTWKWLPPVPPYSVLYMSSELIGVA